MTAVHIKGIRKEFGAFTAIENIDLDINSGELVALLGPSGCGKTTILRILSGLDTPTAGEIYFDGLDVSDQAVQDRNVGMVFQRYALFPHMSVEDNVKFGLSVRNTPKQEISERLEEMLNVVQLQEFRYRFPAQLSGGQMQRVAIARTLITKPSVLMMDEPLANLDTKLRGEMRTFIRAMQQRFSITTIFVTHDQVEALELADRIAVILDGYLVQFDTPDVIYQQPKTVSVADFMGCSNIFPGQMTAVDKVKTNFGSVTIASQASFSSGDEVHVMLRDEAIDILDSPEGAKYQVLQGKITACNFFGATVKYIIYVDGENITVTEQSRRLLEVGRTVWLDIPPEHVWLMAN